MDSDLGSRIAAAFRRLPLIDGVDKEVYRFSALLADVAGAQTTILVRRRDARRRRDRRHRDEEIEFGMDVPPRQFRTAGRKTCIKQLTSLAATMDKIVDALEELYEPSIDALADQHVLRTDLQQFAEQWAAAIRRAAVSLANIQERQGAGRPSDNYAQVVSAIIAAAYQRLTGKRPTLSVRDGNACGLFFDLVREIFGVMSMSASPEMWARSAIRELRARDKVKITATNSL